MYKTCTQFFSLAYLSKYYINLAIIFPPGIEYYEDFSNSSYLSPFNYCLNLEEINLAHNNITGIKRDWNQYHVNLKLLDLSYNNLNNLTNDDLQFISNDIMINLSYNNITSISLDTITKKVDKNYSLSTKKKVVNLSENPIKCDCEIYDFWRYIDFYIHLPFQSTTTFLYDNLSCYTPERLSGLPVNIIINIIFCFN